MEKEMAYGPRVKIRITNDYNGQEECLKVRINH